MYSHIVKFFQIFSINFEFLILESLTANILNSEKGKYFVEIVKKKDIAAKPLFCFRSISLCEGFTL